MAEQVIEQSEADDASDQPPRIVIPALTVSVLAALLAGFGLLTVEHKRALQLAQTQTAQARQASEQQAVLLSQSFAAALEPNITGDVFRIQEALDGRLRYPQLTDVSIIDEDDMIIASKSHPLIGTTLTDSAWRSGERKETETVVKHAGADGRHQLIVTQPLHEKSGLVAGWARFHFAYQPSEPATPSMQDHLAATAKLVGPLFFFLFMAIFLVLRQARTG